MTLQSKHINASFQSQYLLWIYVFLYFVVSIDRMYRNKYGTLMNNSFLKKDFVSLFFLLYVYNISFKKMCYTAM